jgi:hypothetical protein
MKLLNATAYRLNDFKKSVAIFYLVILCIFLLSFILASVLTVDNINVNGMGISTLIFIFVAGLNAFKPYLKMFLQNGISRLSLYLSAILSLLALSLFCSLADNLLALIIVGKVNYFSSMFSALYKPGFLSDFLWTATCYFMVSSFGFFLSVLYYRMNTLLKVAFSTLVPLFIFVGLPILAVVRPDLNIPQILGNFLVSALGLNWSTGVNNPYTAMFSFMMGGAILLALAYPLIHRATLEDV